ncbi:hypothetical protein [Trabulsiella odontotermitis]|uniref:hypothetical protein n=1 Tax=Trabulsiella odontotermitis TaxID=379893 RepID=UPI000A405269|nr:hypothetical protein [Trabulsiella odontotermitis]
MHGSVHLGPACDSSIEFIQTQVWLTDNGIIFISVKLRRRSRFVSRRQKTKNPAGARFLSTAFAGGSRRTHCVTSTAKVYANGKERAIFGTDFDVLSMDDTVDFVQKILFMHTVFIYNEDVHFVRFGGRVLHGRNEVLAETGGAVSALPLREHTVLRQQRGWLQAAER